MYGVNCDKIIGAVQFQRAVYDPVGCPQLITLNYAMMAKTGRIIGDVSLAFVKLPPADKSRVVKCSETPDIAWVLGCTIGLDLIDPPEVSGTGQKTFGSIGFINLATLECIAGTGSYIGSAGAEVHFVHNCSGTRNPAEGCIRQRSFGTIRRVGVIGGHWRSEKAPDIACDRSAVSLDLINPPVVSGTWS